MRHCVCLMCKRRSQRAASQAWTSLRMPPGSSEGLRKRARSATCSVWGSVPMAVLNLANPTPPYLVQDSDVTTWGGCLCGCCYFRCFPAMFSMMRRLTRQDVVDFPFRVRRLPTCHANVVELQADRFPSLGRLRKYFFEMSASS